MLLSEDAECIRTDVFCYENTFLSDYKLPFALDREYPGYADT